MTIKGKYIKEAIVRVRETLLIHYEGVSAREKKLKVYSINHDVCLDFLYIAIAI